MRHQSNGFTLIEVLIVLAIVAILLTLAIPNTSNRITQQRIHDTIQLVAMYQPMIEKYYHLNNRFPNNHQDINLPEPDHIIGHYLQATEIQSGSIHLILGNKLPPSMHGKIVSLRPVVVKDSPLSPISWVCGYDDAPHPLEPVSNNRTNVEPDFLPLGCR